VRAEEKELEGPELEREVGLEEQEVEQEAEEMPILVGEESVDLELLHRGKLFDAIQLILANEKVNVSLLYLPQREAHALEFLQAAVTGSDSMGEFVFAEDRQVLLEQALAILQANVTHGDQSQLGELHAKFEELSTRVGELRAQLLNLEDAQDDLFDEKRQYYEEQATDAEADDVEAPETEPEPQDSITDFIAAALHALADVAPEREPQAPKSTLAGPEVPDKAAEPTTLVGPEVPDLETPPTTLVGPEVPDKATEPTTLVGPEVPDLETSPTTLVGPELPETPPRPSTLDADAPPPIMSRTRTAAGPPVVARTRTPSEPPVEARFGEQPGPPVVSRTRTPPAKPDKPTKGPKKRG